jgi:uncharacterized protein (DUF302 family)
MSYYYSRMIPQGLDDAEQAVTLGLKDEGFGVLTRIDIQQTLKEKLNVDFQPYLILGACHPEYAHQALQSEDKIGTMLPCNVILQQVDDRRTEVAAVDPVASMQAVSNKQLEPIAEEIRERLQRVIDSL